MKRSVEIYGEGYWHRSVISEKQSKAFIQNIYTDRTIFRSGTFSDKYKIIAIKNVEQTNHKETESLSSF